MSHQQNHLAKGRKNIFDKSIAQMEAELNLAKKTIATALSALRAGHDPQYVITHLEKRLKLLDEMKQNRG